MFPCYGFIKAIDQTKNLEIRTVVSGEYLLMERSIGEKPREK